MRSSFNHTECSTAPDVRLDTSITIDNLQEKIAEYYRKALEYYRVVEPKALAAGQYFTLTVVYGYSGYSHLGLGEKNEACENFDLSLRAYYEEMRLHPTAHTDNQGWNTFPATVAEAKKEAECREAT
jgi:hypothetical protein